MKLGNLIPLVWELDREGCVPVTAGEPKGWRRHVAGVSVSGIQTRFPFTG